MGFVGDDAVVTILLGDVSDDNGSGVAHSLADLVHGGVLLFLHAVHALLSLVVEGLVLLRLLLSALRVAGHLDEAFALLSSCGLLYISKDGLASISGCSGGKIRPRARFFFKKRYHVLKFKNQYHCSTYQTQQQLIFASVQARSRHGISGRLRKARHCSLILSIKIKKFK